jgi:PncC family amidohydrolase
MSSADRAAQVVRRMTEAGQTIVTVEATTGGLTGHRIVAVPGASKVFVGGVAAYGRRPKTGWLDVPDSLIQQHGSVSEETAIALARGARESLGTDVAIAETGIASDTGNPDRPAGLYCLALVAEGYERVERHTFEGDRTGTMEAAADRLLAMVEEYLDATG